MQISYRILEDRESVGIIRMQRRIVVELAEYFTISLALISYLISLRDITMHKDISWFLHSDYRLWHSRV